MITLQDIIDKCECSVTVTVNDHRDEHRTVYEYLSNLQTRYTYSEIRSLSQDVIDQMAIRNTIVQIQAYPRTPIGFYRVFHYDLQQAIANMYGLLQGE